MCSISVALAFKFIVLICACFFLWCVPNAVSHFGAGLLRRENKRYAPSENKNELLAELTPSYFCMPLPLVPSIW